MISASLLDEVAAVAEKRVEEGRAADYLPPTTSGFGFAVATVEGEVHGVGRWKVGFSIQSISKVFALIRVLSSSERLWRRMSREPSGTAFDSLVQLEQERGVPRNPFVNAGALVTTDELLGTAGDASTSVLELLRDESGDHSIEVDEEVFKAEIEHGHRTAAMAHLMTGFTTLHHPVDDVLEHYFRQCSVTMNCAQLARAGLVLARHGTCADGSRLLTPSQAKRINAVMLTCGTYDAAGDFAYRVGLPGKSGVSGGILAIAPGHGALCAWSPRLDGTGNSPAGVAALDAFTARTAWSIF